MPRASKVENTYNTHSAYDEKAGKTPVNLEL